MVAIAEERERGKESGGKRAEERERGRRRGREREGGPGWDWDREQEVAIAQAACAIYFLILFLIWRMVTPHIFFLTIVPPNLFYSLYIFIFLIEGV